MAPAAGNLVWAGDVEGHLHAHAALLVNGFARLHAQENFVGFALLSGVSSASRQ
jgi:hypothetical protein